MMSKGTVNDGMEDNLQQDSTTEKDNMKSSAAEKDNIDTSMKSDSGTHTSMKSDEGHSSSVILSENGEIDNVSVILSVADEKSANSSQSSEIVSVVASSNGSKSEVSDEKSANKSLPEAADEQSSNKSTSADGEKSVNDKSISDNDTMRDDKSKSDDEEKLSVQSEYSNYSERDDGSLFTESDDDELLDNMMSDEDDDEKEAAAMSKEELVDNEESSSKSEEGESFSEKSEEEADDVSQDGKKIGKQQREIDFNESTASQAFGQHDKVNFFPQRNDSIVIDEGDEEEEDKPQRRISDFNESTASQAFGQHNNVRYFPQRNDSVISIDEEGDIPQDDDQQRRISDFNISTASQAFNQHDNVNFMSRGMSSISDDGGGVGGNIDFNESTASQAFGEHDTVNFLSRQESSMSAMSETSQDDKLEVVASEEEKEVPSPPPQSLNGHTKSVEEQSDESAAAEESISREEEQEESEGTLSEESEYSEIEDDKPDAAEKDRLVQEKVAAEKEIKANAAETEKVEKDKLEQERLAAAEELAKRQAEKEMARIEADRLAAEEAANKEKRQAEIDRLDMERIKQEQILAADKKAEIEKLESKRIGRLEQDKLEQERIESDRLEQARLAEEARLKAENELLEQERDLERQIAEAKAAFLKDVQESLRTSAEEQEELKQDANAMEQAADPIDTRLEEEDKFERKLARSMPSPGLRGSLKKTQSSPIQSNTLRTSQRSLRSLQSLGSSKSSSGGRIRRRSSRGSSSSKKSADRKLSPLDKLKLAQSKLKNSDNGEGGGNFKREEFAELLESSIRDLQDGMEDDSKDEEKRMRRRLSKSESFEYSSPGYTKKSSSSRSRHSARGRSARSLGNSRGKSGSRSKLSSQKSGSKPRRRSTGDSQEFEGVTQEKTGSKASVPRGVKKALACCKGGEALPRETAVSNVVRRLVSKIDREELIADEDDEKGPSCCVAILSSPSDIIPPGYGGGEGKTTLAALACVRGDVRTRYHQGIAWLNRENRSLDLDFESYSKALSDICRQIGVKPQQLRLSPVVRTPGEDGQVAKLRMQRHMKEAQTRMGKLLTSLQRSSKRLSRKDDSELHISVLIVLDDVSDESDIEWFQFRRGGKIGNDQINDLLITSRQPKMEKVTPITVPELETKEALRLLATESDLQNNHPLSNNRVAKGLVKECLHHPLTIKFAGRWLSLKRATSGGQKGIDEILNEINTAMVEAKDEHCGDSVDVLHALLKRAMSPLVKGKATTIVRLCFAALIDVFYKEICLALVQLDIANDFFLKVVENEKEVLSQSDTFYKNNGRQSAKLVPEILGAMGVFNITKHSTGESSIQIDHDLICLFSHTIHRDQSMQHLVTDEAIQRWNKAYVQSYLDQKKSLWDDLQPDHSRKYALGKMPTHMIRAEMFEETEALMLNESFIRGRFWSLGWTEGTRLHVTDTEAFCKQLQRCNKKKKKNADKSDDDDYSSKLVDVCRQLEAVLMEEVARESGGPKGRCSTLEAGRCLHEISVSLARFRIWDEASRFCSSCVELVESNLGPSDLVASLLYNSSVMHVEANQFEEAELVIGDCLDMRVKTCGTESIWYVRALCQLGDILSVSSDYSTADTIFNKCIEALREMPARYHLDYGIALYRLGRNQHRRGGYLDEALHCYEEALEYEKAELGSNHIFISSILMHMGDLLLDNDDAQQAKHTITEALDVLSEVDDSTCPYFEKSIKFAIAKGKLLSIEEKSDECIAKYQEALSLLHKHAPTKKKRIAQVNSMIASEHEKKGNYYAAEQFYSESVRTSKACFGAFHLDTAEALVNLSGVKSALSALGEVKEGEPLPSERNSQASGCLIEAIDIQTSRLGDCDELVITLSIYGSHLRTIGDYKKSEFIYLQALRILKGLEGDQDLTLLDTLFGFAELKIAMRKYNGAAECYKRCLAIQEKLHGKKHDDIASTLYAMGVMMDKKGLYSESLGHLARCLVMRVQLHGENNSDVADTYDMLGFVEAKKGDLDVALKRLTNSLKVRKAVGDKLKEADTLLNLGNLYKERKEFDLACQHYDDCLKIRKSELGEVHQSVADILMELGNVQSEMENPDIAVSHYREALQVMITLKGESDPSAADIFVKVGMINFRVGRLERAMPLLNKAVDIYREGGTEYESKLVSPLFVIGNIHKLLKQSKKARGVWSEAYELSTKYDGFKSDKILNKVHLVLQQMIENSDEEEEKEEEEESVKKLPADTVTVPKRESTETGSNEVEQKKEKKENKKKTSPADTDIVETRSVEVEQKKAKSKKKPVSEQSEAVEDRNDNSVEVGKKKEKSKKKSSSAKSEKEEERNGNGDEAEKKKVKSKKKSKKKKSAADTEASS